MNKEDQYQRQNLDEVSTDGPGPAGSGGPGLESKKMQDEVNNKANEVHDQIELGAEKDQELRCEDPGADLKSGERQEDEHCSSPLGRSDFIKENTRESMNKV